MLLSCFLYILWPLEILFLLTLINILVKKNLFMLFFITKLNYLFL